MGTAKVLLMLGRSIRHKNLPTILKKHNNLSTCGCGVKFDTVSNTVLGNKYLPFSIYLQSVKCSTFGHKNKPPLTREQIDAEREKRRKKMVPRITLIGTDQNISVPTLEEAEKIASRRRLKLVKVSDFDTKSERPIYRLMTGTQLLAEERKSRQDVTQKKSTGSLKGDKILSISSKIAEHDLSSKLKNVKKWLEKNYEVKVTVSGAEGKMDVAVSAW